MKSREERIRKGFTRLAPFYDLLAGVAFCGALGRIQRQAIESLSPPASVLVVGGGTGRILQYLAAVETVQRIVFLDISPEMCQRATSALKAVGLKKRGSVICSSFARFTTTEQFDLILMPFFLDMFHHTQIREIGMKVTSLLTPEGELVVIDFSQATDKRLRVVTASATWVMYRFFRVLCHIDARHLPPYAAALGEAGLVPLKSSHYLGGWVISQLFRRKGERCACSTCIPSSTL